MGQEVEAARVNYWIRHILRLIFVLLSLPYTLSCHERSGNYNISIKIRCSYISPFIWLSAHIHQPDNITKLPLRTASQFYFQTLRVMDKAETSELDRASSPPSYHWADWDHLCYANHPRHWHLKHEMTQCVRCRTWKLRDMNKQEQQSEYRMRIRYKDHLEWHHINVHAEHNFNPSKDVFNCIPDHNIRDLSVIGNDTDHFVIAWKNNERNCLFKFNLNSTVVKIWPHQVWRRDHNLSSGYREFAYTKYDEGLVDNLCHHINRVHSLTIAELSPCTRYRVCVETRFRNDPTQTFHKCIKKPTWTLCAPPRHSRSAGPVLSSSALVATSIIGACILSTLVTLMVLFYWNCVHRRRRVRNDAEGDALVIPRSPGSLSAASCAFRSHDDVSMTPTLCDDVSMTPTLLLSSPQAPPTAYGTHYANAADFPGEDFEDTEDL